MLLKSSLILLVIHASLSFPYGGPPRPRRPPFAPLRPRGPPPGPHRPSFHAPPQQSSHAVGQGHEHEGFWSDDKFINSLTDLLTAAESPAQVQQIVQQQETAPSEIQSHSYASAPLSPQSPQGHRSHKPSQGFLAGLGDLFSSASGSSKVSNGWNEYAYPGGAQTPKIRQEIRQNQNVAKPQQLEVQSAVDATSGYFVSGGGYPMIQGRPNSKDNPDVMHIIAGSAGNVKENLPPNVHVVQQGQRPTIHTQFETQQGQNPAKNQFQAQQTQKQTQFQLFQGQQGQNQAQQGQLHLFQGQQGQNPGQQGQFAPEGQLPSLGSLTFSSQLKDLAINHVLQQQQNAATDAPSFKKQKGKKNRKNKKGVTPATTTTTELPQSTLKGEDYEGQYDDEYDGDYDQEYKDNGDEDQGAQGQGPAKYALTAPQNHVGVPVDKFVFGRMPFSAPNFAPSGSGPSAPKFGNFGPATKFAPSGPSAPNFVVGPANTKTVILGSPRPQFVSGPVTQQSAPQGQIYNGPQPWHFPKFQSMPQIIMSQPQQGGRGLTNDPQGQFSQQQKQVLQFPPQPQPQPASQVLIATVPPTLASGSPLLPSELENGIEKPTSILGSISDAIETGRKILYFPKGVVDVVDHAIGYANQNPLVGSVMDTVADKLFGSTKVAFKPVQNYGNFENFQNFENMQNFAPQPSPQLPSATSQLLTSSGQLLSSLSALNGQLLPSASQLFAALVPKPTSPQQSN